MEKVNYTMKTKLLKVNSYTIIRLCPMIDGPDNLDLKKEFLYRLLILELNHHTIVYIILVTLSV